MTTPFEFDTSQNLYAYSVERLIDLCAEYPAIAHGHITQGNLERWLDKIGEIELYKIVKKFRRSPEKYQLYILIDKFKAHLKTRKLFELLDIDKAIEITLKEYETLRAEILQNLSEITQRIFLGLAAIFTIASLALAPLSDFLGNQEFIIVNGLKKINLEDTKVKISEIDAAFGTISIEGKLNTQNKSQFFKTIKENSSQANKSSIIPSIFMFVVLIPFLSLYLVYRSLFVIEKAAMIGKYIYFRIERKLVDLTKLKSKKMQIDIESINNKYLYLDIYKEDQGYKIKKYELKDYLTHLSWEHYVRISPSFIHSFDIFSILLLFTIIIILSWSIVGFLLFTNNYSFREDLPIIIFLIICFIVQFGFGGCCLKRVQKIREPDKKDIKNSKLKPGYKFDEVINNVIKEMWGDS